MKGRIFIICMLSLIFGLSIILSNCPVLVLSKTASTVIARAEGINYRYSANKEEMREEEQWYAFPEEGQDIDPNYMEMPIQEPEPEDDLKNMPFETDSEEETYQEPEEEMDEESSGALESRR